MLIPAAITYGFQTFVVDTISAAMKLHGSFVQGPAENSQNEKKFYFRPVIFKFDLVLGVWLPCAAYIYSMMI